MIRHQIVKSKNYERALVARVNAYVVNAEPDLAYLADFLPAAKLHVIPNGVDTVYFHPSPETAVHPQLVFTGNLSYRFNADAVLYFHARVFPHVRAEFPDARFVVVGAHPSSEVTALAQQDRLTTVTGFVDDVRPYVWDESVFVCPLRGGTGLKNKLLNGMAMAKAIVATPLSADGLGVSDGEQLLLAADDTAFAEQIVRLLKDRALRQRLGAAGRAFVEQNYSVSSFGAQFEALYDKIMRMPQQSKTNSAHAK